MDDLSRRRLAHRIQPRQALVDAMYSLRDAARGYRAAHVGIFGLPSGLLSIVDDETGDSVILCTKEEFAQMGASLKVTAHATDGAIDGPEQRR